MEKFRKQLGIDLTERTMFRGKLLTEEEIREATRPFAARHEAKLAERSDEPRAKRPIERKEPSRAAAEAKPETDKARIASAEPKTEAVKARIASAEPKRAAKPAPKPAPKKVERKREGKNKGAPKWLKAKREDEKKQ